MSTFDNGFRFASGASRAAHSSSGIRTALAAIAAVSVFSGALVASELIASPSTAGARGETTPAASFEARWWPGEVTTAARRPARMADSDLTFAKGYPQRVAARQALLAARQAEAETETLTPFGRSAALAPRDPHRMAARTSETNGVGTREGRL
jgi:hypothetical protein